MVLYHNTNNNCTTFDTNRRGSTQWKTYGDGIYLFSSKDAFSYAGDEQMQLYAAIRNPFGMDLTADQVQEVYDKYFRPHHAETGTLRMSLMFSMRCRVAQRCLTI